MIFEVGNSEDTEIITGRETQEKVCIFSLGQIETEQHSIYSGYTGVASGK